MEKRLNEVRWKYCNLPNVQIGSFANDPVHPAGYTNGPIIRDFYTFQCVTQGCGVVVSGGEEFPVNAGQCFFTFPNTVVEERADNDKPWALLWVLLRGSTVETCINALGVSPQNPVLPEPYSKFTEACMLDLVSSSGTSNAFNQLFQLKCICDIFLELSHSGDSSSAIVAVDSSPSHYVHDVMHYIETNFDKKLSIGEIAAKIGINRSYLYSLFKEETGMSLQEYLISVRMKKACTYLSFPDVSIASVANSIGYEPLVFSKTFKAYTGMSPRAYRKQLLEKR